MRRISDISCRQGRVDIQDDGHQPLQERRHLARHVRDAQLFRDHAGAGLL